MNQEKMKFWATLEGLDKVTLEYCKRCPNPMEVVEFPSGKYLQCTNKKCPPEIFVKYAGEKELESVLSLTCENCGGICPAVDEQIYEYTTDDGNTEVVLSLCPACYNLT